MRSAAHTHFPNTFLPEHREKTREKDHEDLNCHHADMKSVGRLLLKPKRAQKSRRCAGKEWEHGADSEITQRTREFESPLPCSHLANMSGITPPSDASLLTPVSLHFTSLDQPKQWSSLQLGDLQENCFGEKDKSAYGSRSVCGENLVSRLFV